MSYETDFFAALRLPELVEARAAPILGRHRCAEHTLSELLDLSQKRRSSSTTSMRIGSSDKFFSTFYSRMRSEGFPFIVWGSGGWTVFASFAAARRVGGRRSASERVGARCVVNSVPCGSASRPRRVCGVCGAVPWGLLLGRSRGWRRVIRIGEQGGAVSLGLVSRASRGWRRVIRIGSQGVVWVAPCH